MQGLKSFTRLIVVDSQHRGGGGVIVAGVARELRRKPRKHCCCYYQSRCQSVTDCHGSSIAGTHAVCARAPAQDSLACASTRHQAVLAAAARVVSGECTASSGRRSATSVPTRLARSVERERRLSPPTLPLCRSLLRIYFRYATPRGRAEMARSDACHATCHVVPTAGT